MTPSSSCGATSSATESVPVPGRHHQRRADAAREQAGGRAASAAPSSAPTGAGSTCSPTRTASSPPCKFKDPFTHVSRRVTPELLVGRRGFRRQPRRALPRLRAQRGRPQPPVSARPAGEVRARRPGAARGPHRQRAFRSRRHQARHVGGVADQPARHLRVRPRAEQDPALDAQRGRTAGSGQARHSGAGEVPHLGPRQRASAAAVGLGVSPGAAEGAQRRCSSTSTAARSRRRGPTGIRSCSSWSTSSATS